MKGLWTLARNPTTDYCSVRSCLEGPSGLKGFPKLLEMAVVSLITNHVIWKKHCFTTKPNHINTSVIVLIQVHTCCVCRFTLLLRVQILDLLCLCQGQQIRFKSLRQCSCLLGIQALEPGVHATWWLNPLAGAEIAPLCHWRRAAWFRKDLKVFSFTETRLKMQPKAFVNLSDSERRASRASSSYLPYNKVNKSYCVWFGK